MKNLAFLLILSFFGLTACDSQKSTKAEDSMHQSEESHMDDGHSHGDEDGKDEGHMDDGHSHGDEDHQHKGTSEEKRDIASTSIKNEKTSAIIEGYLELKNALTKDDQKGAVKGATSLLSAFAGFDMSSLTKEQHEEYMDIIENAKEQAEHIEKSPIDHQREHFEVLSTDINDLIALVGTDKTLYETFCPMANGGKGAIWLSETKEIKNPFMGSKMIKCGKVQRQIN